MPSQNLCERIAYLRIVQTGVFMRLSLLMLCENCVSLSSHDSALVSDAARTDFSFLNFEQVFDIRFYSNDSTFHVDDTFSWP